MGWVFACVFSSGELSCRRKGEVYNQFAFEWLLFSSLYSSRWLEMACFASPLVSRLMARVGKIGIGRLFTQFINGIGIFVRRPVCFNRCNAELERLFSSPILTASAYIH